MLLPRYDISNYSTDPSEAETNFNFQNSYTQKISVLNFSCKQSLRRGDSSSFLLLYRLHHNLMNIISQKESMYLVVSNFYYVGTWY